MEITPGAECLIKHVSNRVSIFSAIRYQAAKVTRVTKARVFVRADFKDAAEREFRLDNLREYGERTWRADELVVDPALVTKALAEQEAERARRALEGQALVAIADLRALFEGDKVRNRSESEIAALVALRDSLRIPAAENAGPG